MAVKYRELANRAQRVAALEQLQSAPRPGVAAGTLNPSPMASEGSR
jgi:hypothetical protein